MQRELLDAFHKQWHESKKTWHTVKYRGVKALKCPLDLWIYSELIYKFKPELIVETGTCFGGTALYLADLCETYKRGKVLTIDTRPPQAALPSHPRLMLHQSSSVAKSAKDKVTALAKGKRVMVFLDSDHSKQHVLAELNFYSTIANTYLVVEDTDIGKHVRQDFGPGPAEAVTEFLETNKNFVVDSKCERLMLTFNPGGYLRYVG